MNYPLHHIRLVAGFEIRPPAGQPHPVFEHADAERLGGLIAEDLAACMPEVTPGQLVTGPALLEPGQIISPDHAPWETMLRAIGPDPEPGVTSLGAHAGRMAHAPLMPYWIPPRGLFVCLPIVLVAPDHQALSSRLERTLFETGGLRPPALGTLAEISGLDPVHGQLMTRADLMALVKVQLAGAGLDPFWPPVEHAVLAPQQSARLALPGGLTAEWNIEGRGWELDFVPFDAAAANPSDFALWLRALRQTTAVLESHLVRWRARSRVARVEIDPQGRWASCDLGPAAASSRARVVQHPDVGVVAYVSVIGARRKAFYPLDPAALTVVESMLGEAGIEHFDPVDTLELLSVS